jgi:hypothetical protein
MILADPLSQEGDLDTRILDGHAGSYRRNDHAVMTITRDGAQPTAQWTRPEGISDLSGSKCRILPQGCPKQFHPGT